MTLILVADDNEPDVYLLREGLHASGLEFEIEHVTDGEQVMQRLNSQPLPDLLALDLHLPRISGKTIVAAIQERGIALPVIVLTSLYSPRDREDLGKLGVMLVLEKPGDLESCFALGRRIHDFIANRP